MENTIEAYMLQQNELIKSYQEYEAKKRRDVESTYAGYNDEQKNLVDKSNERAKIMITGNRYDGYGDLEIAEEVLDHYYEGMENASSWNDWENARSDLEIGYCGLNGNLTKFYKFKDWVDRTHPNADDIVAIFNKEYV